MRGLQLTLHIHLGIHARAYYILASLPRPARRESMFGGRTESGERRAEIFNGSAAFRNRRTISGSGHARTVVPDVNKLIYTRSRLTARAKKNQPQDCLSQLHPTSNIQHYASKFRPLLTNLDSNIRETDVTSLFKRHLIVGRGASRPSYLLLTGVSSLSRCYISPTPRVSILGNLANGVSKQ